MSQSNQPLNNELLQLKAQLDKLEHENEHLKAELNRQKAGIATTTDLYQTVLNSIPIRMFWKDRELHYLGANNSFLQDAQCASLEELKGKDDYQLPWKHSEAAAFRQDDRAVMESGVAKFNIEEPQTRADGQTGWLRTNKSPLKSPTGELLGVLGTYEDITQEKQQRDALAASEARFKALFDSSFQFIGILNPDGLIQMVNATVANRFEIAEQDVMGQYFPATPFWTHDENEQRKIIDAIKKAQQGQLARFTTYHVTRSGERVYVDFSLKPVLGENGSLQMLIPEGRDITDKVYAEQQLKELNETLEARVADRTLKLEQSNQELCKALDLLQLTQDELVQSEKMASLGGLVSGFAHEINTPLGVGITAASHLQEELRRLARLFEENKLTRSHFEAFFESASEGGSMLMSNLQRTSDLIRGFKRVAVDQSSEALRRINVQEYLNEIVLSLRPKLRKGNVEVELKAEEELHFLTYPGCIAQIFTNLIMNSLIHAFDRKKEPKISIQAYSTGEQLKLVYADNGSGMTKEIVRQIFEPFFTTKLGDGGSGLGMNIVFNIVTQKLKGMISCHSELDQGTQFVIELPFNITESETPKQA